MINEGIGPKPKLKYYKIFHLTNSPMLESLLVLKKNNYSMY